MTRKASGARFLGDDLDLGELVKRDDAAIVAFMSQPTSYELPDFDLGGMVAPPVRANTDDDTDTALAVVIRRAEELGQPITARSAMRLIATRRRRRIEGKGL